MAISQITYSDKSDINTSSVPATNKVAASDMNEIKQVVNTNANLVGDVSNLNTSATTVVGAVNEVNTPFNIVTDGSEIKVGYQIDGHDVYAKRFTIPSLTNGTQIPHGLSNFEVVDWKAVTYYGGVWRKLNYPLSGGYYVINVDSTNIIYYASSSLTGTGYITLYYIKTS